MSGKAEVAGHDCFMGKAANAAWRKSIRKDCLISIAYQYQVPFLAEALSAAGTSDHSVPTRWTITGRAPRAGRIFSVRSFVAKRMELVFSQG